jgi:hypothetical protein
MSNRKTAEVPENVLSREDDDAWACPSEPNIHEETVYVLATTHPNTARRLTGKVPEGRSRKK